MADTIKASFHGVQDVRKDLESVRLGLGRELSALLRSGVDSVARKTSGLTPRGPGPQSLRDNLPHVAETISGVAIPTGVAVVSSHPAAPVLEYGGTISPRGVPITISQHAMAHRAGDAELPRLERDLTARVDALLRAHGLA
jgi:hypothetical protein